MPKEAKIHDVFHVSQLKLFHENLPSGIHIPCWMQGKSVETQIKHTIILNTRAIKFQNKAQV